MGRFDKFLKFVKSLNIRPLQAELKRSLNDTEWPLNSETVLWVFAILGFLSFASLKI